MLTGQRILVTGVTGRLGGAFAHSLAPHNDVWALARFGASTRRDFNAQSTAAYWEGQGVTVRTCDLSLGVFDGVPTDFDYVLHAAANTYGTSFDQSVRDNVDGVTFLMRHCQTATAFLHVSTVGVYVENPDPSHAYKEDLDPIGGGGSGHYTGTKTLAEGAVRAMSQTLPLPTVICRMDIQYGTFSDGGMPVRQLRQILHGEPIRLPKSYPLTAAPISEGDLVNFIEPCLQKAEVPPLTVNWCGDENVRFEEYLDYMGELVGTRPIYVYDDEGHGLRRARGWPDPTRRQAITGPCRTTWRIGLEQIVAHWEPLLRAAGPASARHLYR